VYPKLISGLDFGKVSVPVPVQDPYPGSAVFQIQKKNNFVQNLVFFMLEIALLPRKLSPRMHSGSGSGSAYAKIPFPTGSGSGSTTLLSFTSHEAQRKG
jgi:hypothetical protein